MKRVYTYPLFVFMLMFKITSAQITFKTYKKDIGCMHSSLGRAEIVVSPQINPPYSYKWSTGQITSSIENLEHDTYKVTVTDSLGKDTTAIIIIRELECEMIPEIIFTPNEDGYKDTWQIGNYQYFSNALILVYNRWGQKVYEHSGLYQLPWDGKDMFRVEVPDATYYYVIYKDQNKKNELTKGSVSIIR